MTTTTDTDDGECFIEAIGILRKYGGRLDIDASEGEVGIFVFLPSPLPMSQVDFYRMADLGFGQDTLNYGKHDPELRWSFIGYNRIKHIESVLSHGEKE